MFKFWMSPKPNSFTWNEKARGEGTRASLHRRAILTARERFRFAPNARRDRLRARARATASDPPLPPSRDVTEIDHSSKFAARYLHRCTAVGVRLPPASLLARQPRRRPGRERRVARRTRVLGESDLSQNGGPAFSSFLEKTFLSFRACRRLRSALALPRRASLEPRVTRARRVFTPRARSPHRLD